MNSNNSQPVIIESTASEVVGARKIDTGRGTLRTEVSSQWFSRPDDQKFLNLNDLEAFCRESADNSEAHLIDVSTVRVNAGDDPEDLRLSYIPQGHRDIVEAEPNHWSFGQLCSLVQAPAAYLRRLPGQIAGINLQYGITTSRSELVKTYVTRNGHTELRAATGPDYGRILDADVAKAVMRIAGDGTGADGMPWKVPGCIDWRTQTYNPDAPITKESTTLFASDRDIFLFLVDDTHPIEVGKLADGSPDLMFRGFYVWNSEVGNRSFGLAAFYLRGVCQNRCLWGVERFQEMTFRHSKHAPLRFMREVRPALNSFSNGSTAAVRQGVEKAQNLLVAKNDDDALEFLGRQKFTKSQADAIVSSVLKEEGRPARSIWDMVQGITATARQEGRQDARLELERKAGKLLDKATR